MPRILEKLITVFYFIKYRYFLKFSSRKVLKSWQKARLTQFLTWLQEASPYYQKLALGTGLQNYPVIDKSIMMENFSQLNTRGLDRDMAFQVAINSEKNRDFSPMLDEVTVGLSSGTSGHRGLFVASSFERAKYAGSVLAKALPRGRVLRKNKIALFLRANSNLYESLGSKLIDFRFFDICIDRDLHIEKLNQFQPDLLIAQPSVLRFLADKKKSGELVIQPLRIFSAAEVLDDIDRQYIEEAFGSGLHQIYQCTEGFLGITCEFGHLHLNEDLVVFEKEFLKGSAVKFQPILTDFTRTTQPIVKYRLNDILTEESAPCSCGSVFTRIKSIDGRSDDTIFFLKEGGGYIRVWADLIRNHILYSHSQILEYRVVQSASSRLDISLKHNVSGRSGIEQAVLEQLSGLANKLKAKLPEIQFVEYQENTDFSKKLRRIQGVPEALLVKS